MNTYCNFPQREFQQARSFAVSSCNCKTRKKILDEKSRGPELQIFPQTQEIPLEGQIQCCDSNTCEKIDASYHYRELRTCVQFNKNHFIPLYSDLERLNETDYLNAKSIKVYYTFNNDSFVDRQEPIQKCEVTRWKSADLSLYHSYGHEIRKEDGDIEKEKSVGLEPNSFYIQFVEGLLPFTNYTYFFKILTAKNKIMDLDSQWVKTESTKPRQAFSIKFVPEGSLNTPSVNRTEDPDTLQWSNVSWAKEKTSIGLEITEPCFKNGPLVYYETVFFVYPDSTRPKPPLISLKNLLETDEEEDEESQNKVLVEEKVFVTTFYEYKKPNSSSYRDDTNFYNEYYDQQDQKLVEEYNFNKDNVNRYNPKVCLNKHEGFQLFNTKNDGGNYNQVVQFKNNWAEEQDAHCDNHAILCYENEEKPENKWGEEANQSENSFEDPNEKIKREIIEIFKSLKFTNIKNPTPELLGERNYDLFSVCDKIDNLRKNSVFRSFVEKPENEYLKKWIQPCKREFFLANETVHQRDWYFDTYNHNANAPRYLDMKNHPELSDHQWNQTKTYINHFAHKISNQMHSIDYNNEGMYSFSYTGNNPSMFGKFLETSTRGYTVNTVRMRKYLKEIEVYDDPHQRLRYPAVLLRRNIINGTKAISVLKVEENESDFEDLVLQPVVRDFDNRLQISFKIIDDTWKLTNQIYNDKTGYLPGYNQSSDKMRLRSKKNYCFLQALSNVTIYEVQEPNFRLINDEIKVEGKIDEIVSELSSHVSYLSKNTGWFFIFGCLVKLKNFKFKFSNLGVRVRHQP